MISLCLIDSRVSWGANSKYFITTSAIIIAINYASWGIEWNTEMIGFATLELFSSRKGWMKDLHAFAMSLIWT